MIDGVQTECNLCKNAMFLFDGACIAKEECPGSAEGKGNYGRVCKITTTTTRGPTSTSTIAPDTTSAAVPEFIASSFCRGKVTDEGSSCLCHESCHTCEWDSINNLAGPCEKCKNAKVQLASGACVDQSLCDGIVVGSGNFGRVCRTKDDETTAAAATTTTPTPTTDTPKQFFATTVCRGKITDESGTCLCDADCHTCEWDGISNNAGSCSKCKNSKVQLADGTCADETGCDGDVIGKGSFGRFCQTESDTDTTTTTTPVPTTVAPDFFATTICRGRTADTGGVCLCNANCHTCDFDHVNANAGSCSKCKNSKVQLDDGTCADEADCGGAVIGTGSFGRFCQIESDVEVTTTTTAAPTFTSTTTCRGKETDAGGACICNVNCHTCDFDGVNDIAGSCSKCKNSKVQLDDGTCADEADCDGNVVGTGMFGRICQVEDNIVTTTTTTTTTIAEPEFVASTMCRGKETDAGGACICNADCHTCEYDSDNSIAGHCSKCKNSKVELADGTCADESECDGDVIGKGSFGRVCTIRQPTTTTTTTTTAAPAFVATTTCNGKSTSEGAACTCNADCHACEYDGNAGVAGTCQKCKNSQYLFDGICLDSCPEGFDEVGAGTFSRSCVESTRRSRRSFAHGNEAAVAAPAGSTVVPVRGSRRSFALEGEAAVAAPVGSTAVQVTGSSVLFAVFMSVLIIFAVSVIALLKQQWQSSKVNDTTLCAPEVPEDAISLHIDGSVDAV